MNMGSAVYISPYPPATRAEFTGTVNGLNKDTAVQGVSNSQADWVQQMHALETIHWGGGEHHYDGPHDKFCFVCGSGMQLFGCQTCENCYHAGCMTPELETEEVPTFWFCPHCVDRDMHIPTDSLASDYLTPATSASSLLGQGIAFQQASDSLGPANDMEHRDSPDTAQASKTANKRPATLQTSSEKSLSEGAQSIPHIEHIEHRAAREIASNSKRSFSPPRKKSKYSAFSVEVDKALSILYAELETAAHVGKSKEDLQSKLKTLGQQLKMQEGQIMLANREVEQLRSQLELLRGEPEHLKDQNTELLKKVANLQQLVEKKDSELRDWQTKLRNMMGNVINDD